jgi:hypothetical protein
MDFSEKGVFTFFLTQPTDERTVFFGFPQKNFVGMPGAVRPASIEPGTG